MKINIWSDIRCPFCYIGKKKFEQALSQFAHKDKVEITWKSYELDPNMKTDASISTMDYLAKSKGMPAERVEQMLAHAKAMGKEVGVDMNIEASIPANTKNAHRLTQFVASKSQEKAALLTENLFKAHFTEAKNIDDKEVLLALGLEVGMEEEELKLLLNSDDFAYEVSQDQMEAANIGVQGVPFFVLHNKYAISGAQPVEAFLEALNKSWEHYAEDKQPLEIIKGDSCDVDGNCD